MDWRDIPSLAALRAFEAAARHGNYSAAARELNVTHAAIAQHVRALEEDFGVGLMERSGRGMKTTRDGARLARDLSTGFSEIAAGVRALKQSQLSRPLMVATTQSFAESWLVPRLPAFWQAHPECPVSIQPSPHLVDLKRDGFDLAIRFGDGNWPGLKSLPLTPARWVAVASPEYVAKLPKGFSPTAPDAVKTLMQHNWIVTKYDREFFSWLAELDVRAEDVKQTELATNGMVIAATLSGAGISRQLQSVVKRDLESGALIQLTRHDDSARGYHIVWNDRNLSDRAKIFQRWLMKSAAEEQDD
jgi:LysR family glycine cleavage system transcriptional activator